MQSNKVKSSSSSLKPVPAAGESNLRSSGTAEGSLNATNGGGGGRRKRRAPPETSCTKCGEDDHETARCIFKWIKHNNETATTSRSSSTATTSRSTATTSRSTATTSRSTATTSRSTATTSRSTATTSRSTAAIPVHITSRLTNSSPIPTHITSGESGISAATSRTATTSRSSSTATTSRSTATTSRSTAAIPVHITSRLTNSSPIPTHITSGESGISAATSRTATTSRSSSTATTSRSTATTSAGSDPKNTAKTEKQTKKYARQTETKATKDFFAIVTGLNGFVKQDEIIVRRNKRGEVIERFSAGQAITATINEAVQEVSTFMYELGIYVNYCLRRMMDNRPEAEYREYFNNFGMTSIRNFVHQLHAHNLNHPMDMTYATIRSRYPRPRTWHYDLDFRMHFIEEEVKLFEIAMKNNVQRQMKNVLERFFHKIPDHNGRVMSKKRAKTYVRVLLWGRETQIDERLGETFVGWEAKLFRYIPLLYRIQRTFATTRDGEGNVIKNFKLFPMCRAKARHLVIGFKSGLVDLMQRAFPGIFKRKDIEDNPREFWKRFFNIEAYESSTTPDNRNKSVEDDQREFWMNIFGIEDPATINENGDPYPKMFHSITTNGIEVSIRMTRSKLDYKRQQHVQEDPYALYDFIAGIDPGRRLTLGGVLYDLSTEERTCTRLKLSSRKYYHDQGLKQRKALLESWTGHLERIIREDRERNDNIGSTHIDYARYTDFGLKYFWQKITLYTQPRITRLDFDAYIFRQHAIAKMVREFCPEGKRTLVFLGDAFEPANSPIKGYIRSPHLRIYNEFKRLGLVTLKFVDEFRTTMVCCNCFAISPPTKRKGHRYSFCEDCKKTFNRDVNAGVNMVTKGLHQYYGFPLHENLMRTPAENQVVPIMPRARLPVGEREDVTPEEMAEIAYIQQLLQQYNDEDDYEVDALNL